MRSLLLFDHVSDSVLKLCLSRALFFRFCNNEFALNFKSRRTEKIKLSFQGTFQYLGNEKFHVCCVK